MQGIATHLFGRLRPLALAGLCLGLMTAGSAAAATIYKSVDEQGNVQYSQTPPKDRPSEVLDTGHSVTPPSAEPTGKDDAGDSAPEDKAVDPATEVKVIDREKARETCQQAREQRESIANSGNQLMVQDDEGKYQPMSEAQRTERLKRLDAIIEEACAAAGEE
ncbi:DUF4124 domain-containing protein [Guyparkeria sp. 1SP6A2]|nr:DUF4124 domain-containing protein [Guyparkeria sp. 1SP6A2]